MNYYGCIVIVVVVIVIASLIAIKFLGARWFRFKLKSGNTSAELEMGEKSK